MESDVSKNLLELEVVREETNAQTGTHTFHVRVVESDGSGSTLTGPITLHGIDFESLTRNHEGSYEKFLVEKVKDIEIMKYKNLKAAHGEAAALKGKRL